jgi:DNA-binding PadR family transcriptional regulator
MFRYLVLGLLRGAGALHGYALMKAYRERCGVQISTGNFYRELQRLTVEGLVRTAANPDGADPRRTPYEITEAGVLAFESWLSRPNQSVMGQYDDELSARALFVTEANASLMNQVLDRWQEELWIQSKMLERSREMALLPRTDGEPRRFAALPVLLARRLKHVAADLEFLEELRTAYDAWSTPAAPPAKARLVPPAPARAARRPSAAKPRRVR